MCLQTENWNLKGKWALFQEQYKLLYTPQVRPRCSYAVGCSQLRMCFPSSFFFVPSLNEFPPNLTWQHVFKFTCTICTHIYADRISRGIYITISRISSILIHSRCIQPLLAAVYWISDSHQPNQYMLSAEDAFSRVPHITISVSRRSALVSWPSATAHHPVPRVLLGFPFLFLIRFVREKLLDSFLAKVSYWTHRFFFPRASASCSLAKTFRGSWLWASQICPKKTLSFFFLHFKKKKIFHVIWLIISTNITIANPTLSHPFFFFPLIVSFLTCAKIGRNYSIYEQNTCDVFCDIVKDCL
jgi:hypothetical protein